MILRPFSPFPVLKTKRLTLRRLESKDAQGLLVYHSTPSETEFVDTMIYERVDQVEKYISKMNEGVDTFKWIIWAIADIKTDHIMGTISLWNLEDGEALCETGYGLLSQFRNKGYMSEAIQVVEAFGFEKMALKCIDAYTNVLNLPSLKFLESAGYKRIGQCVDEQTITGIPMDMAIYRKSRVI